MECYFLDNFTVFGKTVIFWRQYEKNTLITGFSLKDGGTLKREDCEEKSCDQIDDAAYKIQAFLKGWEVTFNLDLLDFSVCSEFQKKVLAAESKTPRGFVTTYKIISEYLGLKNGARAVGNALSKNPFPLLIPCHRTVRSDGSLGGFQGGAGMKRRLLEMEGIEFDSKNKVVLNKSLYEF